MIGQTAVSEAILLLNDQLVLAWLDLTVEPFSVGLLRLCWVCGRKRPVCDQWGLYRACCSVQLSAGLHWPVCNRTDARARLIDRVQTECWLLCQWSLTKSQRNSFLKLDASPKVCSAALGLSGVLEFWIPGRYNPGRKEERKNGRKPL